MIPVNMQEFENSCNNCGMLQQMSMACLNLQHAIPQDLVIFCYKVVELDKLVHCYCFAIASYRSNNLVHSKVAIIS